MTDRPLSRRHMLAMLSGLPTLDGSVPRGQRTGALGAAAAPPDSFPDGATVLVGGPARGWLAQWGRLITPALRPSLPPGTTVRLQIAGAADGVTAANEFSARVAPDGRTLLMAPGEAAIAWLIGDPRVQFDVGQWVPVLAGTTPALVVARRPLPQGQAGRGIRVGVSRIESPDISAILALELLRMRVIPVPGIEAELLPGAFARGTIDVALLRGENVAARLAALGRIGVRPLFSVGASDPSGAPMRDPAFPAVPQLEETYLGRHGEPPAGALYAGWRATAAAARISFALILAQLTPAAMIALWRQASSQASRSITVQAAADAAGLRPVSDAAANVTMAPIAADMNALLALRQWLNTTRASHAG